MGLSKQEATVNEQTTPTYVAQMRKKVITAEGKVRTDTLTLAEISTITLTFYDFADGSVVNSRNAQSVKNANNVTITADGLLEWTLTTTDTTITDTTLGVGKLERKVALFTVTTTDSKVFRHEVSFFIKQLTKVS